MFLAATYIRRTKGCCTLLDTPFETRWLACLTERAVNFPTWLINGVRDEFLDEIDTISSVELSPTNAGATSRCASRWQRVPHCNILAIAARAGVINMRTKLFFDRIPAKREIYV